MRQSGAGIKKNDGFLPLCREDMAARGWTRVDFVYVTGDAYVDHPSFGGAIIIFFKQKTAYEIRSRDWSSDVCSSHLSPLVIGLGMGENFIASDQLALLPVTRR